MSKISQLKPCAKVWQINHLIKGYGMIEIRNLTKSTKIYYADTMELASIAKSEPRLQYRFKAFIDNKTMAWSDWIDVEDVHINEGEELWVISKKEEL